MLRHEAELLPPFAKAHSFDPATAERGNGLVGLHAYLETGFIRMQPGINPSRAHRVVGDEDGDGSESDDKRRQDVTPAESGDEEHDGADGGEQERGADIRFLEDEEQHRTDFIFSVIGEELGLTATLSVLIAFMVILICGVYIAWNAADTFGMLIATGITFLIAMQVVINLGVVTGALPNKGLALPFISYGGSNLVIMLGCVGLLLNIGRHAGERLPVSASLGDMDELAAPQSS